MHSLKLRTAEARHHSATLHFVKIDSTTSVWTVIDNIRMDGNTSKTMPHSTNFTERIQELAEDKAENKIRTDAYKKNQISKLCSSKLLSLSQTSLLQKRWAAVLPPGGLQLNPPAHHFGGAMGVLDRVDLSTLSNSFSKGESPAARIPPGRAALSPGLQRVQGLRKRFC